MKVILNEDGYIASFAEVGDLVGGIEAADPEDIGHFSDHLNSYRVRDGVIVFDDEREKALQTAAAIADYRSLREVECFSVINRGPLWYDRLTKVQREELREWYQAWLDGTQSLAVPDKPSWLS